MGWAQEVEFQRRKKQGIADPKPAGKQGATNVSSLNLFLGAGILAGLTYVWRKRDDIRKLIGKPQAKKPSTDNGSGSAFQFPKTSVNSPSSPSSAKKKPTVAKSNSDTGSLPRNKVSSNKKNKARKAEKKALKEEKKMMSEVKADFDSKHEPSAANSGGNAIPEDDDIIGGEAGKTFTTTTHTKVPKWYARVRQERGTD
ncbi:hypothetical protein CYMTET_38931 [Cymbomonas tetramitiformis]|uniref:Uncharacterized protein n=1 Tax=Cymbomonas tetramitiformis TaxID=36881 RepID=A0AAE0F4F7_9CHLO|nr:hypothetical protein CYMTET_38931 [Cymbomonas tetramitiformis]